VYYHRNQQYSIVALTDGGGQIAERYAYSAYGEPTILDATLTPLASSAENNRYLYTGREWDEALELYHYRARMYSAESGRFCSRDPIGFGGGSSNAFEFVLARPTLYTDPLGLEVAFSRQLITMQQIGNEPLAAGVKGGGDCDFDV